MVLVAGVDSSTQSCKVVICDSVTGHIVRSGSAPHPDGTEVDPAAWWRAFSDAIERAGGLDDVAAISIAAQQHGLVALDDFGRVIRPSLLWNDTRSALAARDLIGEHGIDRFVRDTGSLPVASFTITKLRWLRDHEPDNAARVAAVCLPHDWLTWRIRGFGPEEESVYGPQLDQLVTDRSDASGTGYFDSTTNHYLDDLVESALGHRPRLPRILAPGESAGATPQGAVVGAGAGDNAAAALGLNAQAGDAVVSIGTSGTVFAVSQTPAHDLSGQVAGFADATGIYLPLIATLNAARVMSSTASLLSMTLDELSQAALTAPPGSEGLVLLPYFDGERTPNLPDARASLHGMTRHNFTPANVARASAEGMLCGLADGLDAVEKATQPARRILLIGGGASSPAVRQIASTIFSVPILLPEPKEYVAVGAAVQAAWALTGSRPTWTDAGYDVIDSALVPSIRESYTHHFSLFYR